MSKGTAKTVIAIAAGAVLLAGLGSADAATHGTYALRQTASYCVESAPADVGVTRARTLLDNAIAAWNSPTHQGSGSKALLLYQQNPCTASTTVRLTALSLGTSPIAGATSTTIRFNTDFAWWDGIGTRLTAEYSYQGILTHEMGHTIGVGHTGKTKWSYDTALPTMSDTATQAESVSMASLQQDDWGMASYIRGGEYRMWSANPGFESGLLFWGTSGDVTQSATYGHTGTGVRLGANANYIWVTSVYDPYTGKSAGTIAPNMSTTPTLYGRTYYKNPAGSSGGIKLRSQYRYLQYDSSKTKSDADAAATHTSWSAISDLGTCSTATEWKTCISSRSLANSTTNDATAFRLYLLSTSTGSVYADKLGSFGGMTQ